MQGEGEGKEGKKKEKRWKGKEREKRENRKKEKRKIVSLTGLLTIWGLLNKSFKHIATKFG